MSGKIEKNYEKIHTILQEYFSNRSTMNEAYLLDVKDKMLSFLYYFGEQEALLYEAKALSELSAEAIKIEKFKEERDNKVAEKTADYNARLFAMNHRMELARVEGDYKKARNMKETLSKMIDSVSQKISILRRENEFNQFTKGNSI
jgi:flagellar biosynthesis/type III secretory pathway protein FliH